MKRFALSLLLLLPLCGWAQEGTPSTNDNPYNNELGFNLGSTTGIGVSYRHWFNRIGIQLCGMPFKYDNDVFLSGGLTGMFSLRNTQYTRIYAYWGNQILYINEAYYDYVNETPYLKHGSESMYCTGIGIGFSFGRVIAFNISVGYGAYQVIGGGYEDLALLPACEVGLYWRF